MRKPLLLGIFYRESHTWTSGMKGLVYQTLNACPDSSRVLVEGDSATGLP
jgi:hypothetical protein